MKSSVMVVANAAILHNEGEDSGVIRRFLRRKRGMAAEKVLGREW